MFNAIFRFKIFFTALLFILLKGSGSIFAQTTQTFNYTGSNQTFVVPCGVYSATVQVWGGGGGGGGTDGSGTPANGGGGGGGYATSVLALTPGTSLTLLVGGGGGAGAGCQSGVGGGVGGYGLGSGGNGANPGSSGCSGPGGGGGGGTGIMNGATILIVAGGGGGAGGGETNSTVAGDGGAAGSNGVAGNSCAAGILGASGSTSGISATQPGVDDPGSGGGGGGLVGGGAGATATGAQNATGGAGGAGGTSQGATITYGAGATPGNSGALGGICGSCSIGGGISTAGGNGVLTITYVDPPPLVSSITNGTATCSFATATVSVSGGTPGYTYTWSPSGGNSAASTNLTTSGIYTAAYTDAGGCTGTATTNIVVISTVITGNVTDGPGTCGVANATVTPTSGTPGYTYTWSPAGGNSAVATNLPAGNYTVSFTDANGCVGAASTSIVIPPGLNMSLTGPVNPYCDTTKLDWVTWSSVTATSGVGSVSSNLNISLTKPSGGLFTTPSLFASGLFPPQYNLPINNTTLGNTQAGLFTFCFSKPVIDPQVAFSSIGQAGIPVPIVTSVPYTVIWPGYGMTYPSNNTLIGTEGYTIIQFPGQHTCIDFNYLTSENYCNLVFGIRDTNCQTTPICKGSSATFTASGGVSYTWAPPVNLSATTGSVVTASPTSYQTYTVIGTDINGCHDTAITSITVNAAPIPTISSFTNVSCFGGNNGAVLVNVTNGLAPYHYLWTDGNTSVKDSILIAGTYSLTVTDTNGCKGTTSQIITQPALLKDSISDAINLSCFGIPNGNSTVGVVGGTTPYTYSWNSVPVQLTATASNLFAGNYIVTVNDANLCSTTATVTLTQPPALTLTATQTNVTCNGLSTGSATATAIGGTPSYIYAWNTAPPQISPIGIAVGLAAGHYIIGVQDANGCQDTTSITITQPAILVDSIVSSKNDSCFGTSVGNAVTGTAGGTMPYTYLWNTTPPQTTATVVNLPAGTYTVTATDTHNCQDTAVVTITQPPLFAASITSFKNDSCFGTSNGNAAAGVVGGTAPYLYAWSTTPPQLNNTAINLTVGIYTVAVKDAQGCITFTTVTITQPSVLALTAAQTDVTCFGLSTGSATATATGGTTPYIYAWNTTPPQISLTGYATALAAGPYSAGVQDANGCQAIVSITIKQPALLVDSIISQKNDSCFGNSNGNAITGASGGTLPYTYSWNTAPAQLTANASNLSAGTYTATLTDAHGCQDTAVVIITQPTVLTSSIISSKNDSCFGNNNGNAIATGAGGTAPYFYLWNTTPAQLSATASNLPMGNYTATVTDIKGCVTTTTVSITQPPILTVSSIPKTICINNTATLIANQLGGTAPYTYLWNNVITTQTNTVNPTSTTVYSLQVNDIKGCTATDTVTVFVRDSLKFFAVSPGAEKCNGFSANLNATGSGGDNLFTYTWNPGGLIGQFVTVSPSATTIYTITLNDACGTPSVTTTVKVIIDPLPQPGFSSDKQNGCYPLCVQFANTSNITSIDTIKYSWTDGKHTSTAIDPSWCYNASGVFTVSLTATSGKGCVSKMSIPNMITVYPHPKAQFYTTPNPTILDPTVQFTDASYAPGSSVTGLFWQTFGDGSDSTSVLPNPQHTYRDTGTYCITLIATNTFGCKDTTKECVFIKPYFTLYIPNAFSPNGDGDNDIFTAVGDYVFNFDMRIFDRWGNLVYHTTHVNNGWNGLMKGGPAQEDVYVYVINASDYHNHSYSYKGTVTLLK